MTGILTKDETLHTAKLVKLNLTDAEVEKLSNMLGQAIDYIKILDELDTSKTEVTYQVTGLTNVFQKENTPSQTISKEEALSNASDRQRDYFGTKAVFNRK